MESREKKWVPLEGNPTIFTEYAQKLGYPVHLLSFTDVFALDDEIWEAMIPQPVAAVILLYEIKPQHRDLVDAEASSKEPAPAFFIKQKISNACGTIALLHALTNTVENVGGFTEGSFLENFYFSTLEATPDARAEFLN